jgi:hypothetical protein
MGMLGGYANGEKPGVQPAAQASPKPAPAGQTSAHARTDAKEKPKDLGATDHTIRMYRQDVSTNTVAMKLEFQSPQKETGAYWVMFDPRGSVGDADATTAEFEEGSSADFYLTNGTAYVKTVGDPAPPAKFPAWPIISTQRLVITCEGTEFVVQNTDPNGHAIQRVFLVSDSKLGVTVNDGTNKVTLNDPKSFVLSDGSKTPPTLTILDIGQAGTDLKSLLDQAKNLCTDTPNPQPFKK